MEGIGWPTLADSCCRPCGNPAAAVLATEDAPSPVNPLGIKSVGVGGISEGYFSSARVIGEMLAHSCEG